MTPDDDWLDNAACKLLGMDPTWWFPARGDSTEPARTVCRSCPVREDCATAALANNERFGIWGGMSERERRRVRRAMYRANGRVIVCVVCGDDFRAPLNGPAACYCSEECRRVGANARQHEYYNRNGRRVAG